MMKKLAGLTCNVRFPEFQQLLIAALCAVVFAGLFPQRSLAQQLTYYDFNAPQATPGQSSTACGSIAGGPAANGVLLCFNYLGADLSFIQDFYPPLIDPDASTDGDTGSTNYAMQITEAAGNQDSSMWYSIPQNVAAGFTVWYAVTLKPSTGSGSTADGLAFVIQNASGGKTDSLSACSETGSGFTVIGHNGGGCIGYGGIDNSVALEFDTYQNSWDPQDPDLSPPYGDNHIALQSCGLDSGGNPIANSPAHYSGNPPEPTNCLITLGGAGALASDPKSSATGSAVTLADGNPHQIVIVYNGPNDSPANYLYVYLDPVFNPGTHTPVAGSVPVFSGPFNITKYINLNNGTAYLGFTAGTGADWEQQTLLGFSFTPHGFGNTNVCPPGQSTPAPCSVTKPVTFTMASSAIIGSVKVVTQGATGLDFQVGSGNTCIGAITAGSSCTVNVTFAPIAPGLRLGAVELFDNSGNLLATQLIYGIGQGPAVAFSPLTSFVQNTGAYPLSGPKGIAVDAAGDIFIADTGDSRVVEVPGNGGGVQTVGTGLNSPRGLAVDGAGDLFIADSGLDEVVEVPAGCTSGACQSVVYNPAPHPSPIGVAVDGMGDLFIADNPLGVIEIPAGCTSSSCRITVGSGWSQPAGLTVDAAGDIFVADAGIPAVVEVPAGCASSACQLTVGSGWSQPESVAVDAAGDVIVTDAGLNAVVEVPAGCTGSSCRITLASTAQPSLGTGFQPFGAAVDAQGNVFVADYGINRVDAILQAFSALNFSPSTVDNVSGDSPESILFQNIGNQTLNAISPGLVLSDTSDFSQVPGPGTPADCAGNFSLTPGAVCNLSIDFDPQSSGAISGSAQFSDNALNNPLSSQSVTLNGTGIAVVPTTYTLTVTETGSGPGAVTSGDGLISCTYASGSATGSCAQSYLTGSSVTLSASPAAGSTFLGWGGACSGTTPTCTVSMTSAMNVSASFSQQSFGSVNVCATGQTSPAPCNSSLSVTFNITANTTIGAIEVLTQGITGLDFAQASGGTCTGAVSAGNSCTVNVSFTPLAPGLRMGAVNLFDNDGDLLGTAPVYGIGQAPVAAFGPGTQTTEPTRGLHYNVGLALDAAGDLFVADYVAGKVVKITPGGVQTTVPATGLTAPIGVAVDGAGDVFIVDLNLPYAVKVTPSGVQTTVGSGLNYPIGIALDGAGDVFIGDQNNNQVEKITPTGIQTTVPVTGLSQPWGVAVDAAGDVFIADGGSNNRVVEVTPGGVQTTVPTTGLGQPYDLAVDAAGDVFIADAPNSRVVEVSPSGVQSTVGTGLNYPSGVTVDTTGDVFIGDQGSGQVFEVNRSQPPSLSFALTAVNNTSADSPRPVSVQNVGNQPLTGSVALTLGTNFTQATSSTCGSGFSLSAGASCFEGFIFTPQTTGYLTGAAIFSDNTMNLASSVVVQAVNLSGISSINGQPISVVPNVVGMTQSAASTALTNSGLTLGAVTTQYSDSEPNGSVIGENPTAGSQVTPGSAVALATSVGVAPTPAPNPLSLMNNYFVTGDYAAAGVTLRGTGVGGIATGTINIPDSTTNPGVSQGVPDGADIIDGFLYWETLENTPSPSGNTGAFNGFPITGQQIGTDLPFTDGALTGTLRVYRADVNAYFEGTNGVRLGSGAFKVSLPDSGGSGLPLTEGVSLVVLYRVLSPSFPLKSIVIYDGSAIPTAATTQNVQGFYDAFGGSGAGENTTLSYSGGTWNNTFSSVSPAAHASQYSVPINAGNAYGAVIFSTPVTNSDNDGILDAWKSGPASGDFFAGQPGYYDVKTQSWVPLPGAQHGQKDLFVQLDYMCGAVLANGACDPSQENLFPAPDAQGNDPLAMVKQAFATPAPFGPGIVLHLEIGNAVPESTCTDNPSSTPPLLCEFPGQPGVVDWKNSLEISKVWPRNFASCAAGGDCTARFPYGQKDSYHYLLFGHSLAVPAWNTPYGTLTSIVVSGGTATLVTADRGPSGTINYCPSRFTISGVQGNPSLNGIYNTSSCPDSQTIILSTPGVPNWTYPNSTLPEPEIGLTSGTVTSISGYSDLGGQDSAVTLGLWETSPTQNMATRANVIAGTTYHEIGHTLGLTHGGRYYDTAGSYIPTYEANCKPNFQSTMNYLFQLDGVGPNSSVAYSDQALTTLLPGSLGSVTQLTDGSGNPATFPTSAWYTPTNPGTGESAASWHCDGTPLTGDTGYRIDASVSPIPTTDAWSTGQNITFDSITNVGGVPYIDGVPYTQLRGYNDVANIDLRQVGATGGEFASLASVLSFAYSTAPLNIAPGGSVTLGTGGTVAVGSGGTVTLSSGGNVTLSSAGTIALGSGGSVTLNNGGTVTLPPSGGTIALGSGGTAALSSGGIVTLSSSGTIALGSGGTVALGSAGTVTLSSGGIIALGSGGSVTVPAGGSYTLPDSGGTVTLDSAGTVALGSGGIFAIGGSGIIALGSGGTVGLSSGGDVTLSSGGIVALGSGGIVALGSGGNFTLSGSGTIALGSGGIVALGSGGSVTLGSGGIVALGSGGNVTISSGGTATLSGGGTVSSGGTIALGSGGTVTFSSGGIVALGSGGSVTLGSGGTVTLGSGGTVALGSGGNVTLSGAGTIALGSGGIVALGSGGTVALGSGGVVALGSGGIVALGSGGTVALGSGGTVALGSGGTVALGSGGAATNELDYDTANSYVRPPVSPSETPMAMPTGQQVVVNWSAPAFGVVATYSVYRSSDGATPILIGSVSGVNGNPPATTFTDTNPDLTSTTVVYTIATILVPDSNGNQRQSPPSPPAMLKNNQTIVLDSLPSSVLISSSPLTVTATAETNNLPNFLEVGFSASGNCSIGSQSIDPASGISSASVTLTSTGSCTITAAQAGSSSYNAADPASGTFSILPAGSNIQSQTIAFGPLPNVQYGGTFSLSATASSGLTVTFSTSGPCTTGGATTGVGLCTITANVLGNSTYSAATATQSFFVLPAVIKVSAASPTINYGQPIPALTYSLSGFVNSDPTSVVSGTAALSTTATATSNVGSYPVTVATGTLAATNYSFLFVPGTLTIQPASQATLMLSAGSPLTYNQSEALIVTGGSTGLAVTYTVTGNSGGSCSVSSGQLTANSGTGSCTVSATMPGNNNYNSVNSNSGTVNLQPASQTIRFTTPPPVAAAYNTSFTVAATGGASGNPVTFVNSGIGACSVTAGTVPGTATYTMTNSTGVCSVIANQAGNTNYAVASLTISVTAAGPAITVSPSSINFGPVAVGSITTETVTVSNTGTAAATISTPLITLLQAGKSDEFVVVNYCLLPLAAGKSCTISVSFIAGAYYSTPQTATLEIMDNAPGSPQMVTLSATVLDPQTITFTTNPPASAAYNASFTVAAKASSGLAVAFTSSGACSNLGATYTMTGATGTCSVIANQAGNSSYSAAPQVTKSVTATKATQTITFTTSPPVSAAYNGSFTVVASASSGLAVTFTNSGACSVTAGTAPGTATYTMTSGTGTCSVIANQAGNSDYSAAPQVTKSVTATKATQTITVTTNPPASAAYKTSFTVAASTSSGLVVTFTSSGVCSVTAGTTPGTATYTMASGTGTCTVIANQAGNSDYSAAPQVTKSVTATLAAQAITFTTNPPASAAYKSSFTVVASASSGLAVKFTSSGACSNSGTTYTMTSSTGTCSVIANQAGSSNYAAAPQVTLAVPAT